jgi:hypothetical protein
VARTRRGTCDGCGKVRKLTYPERKTGIVQAGEEISYYGLCSECFPKVKTQADIIALRKARGPRKRYKKAYPCIGGPLDGEHAATEDFYRDGMYAHLDNEYASYNSSGSFGGGRASMIFVHSSLIKPVISARER